MEMSLLLLMNHKSKLQTNLSIPMMGGVGGRGGDHEESPLSNWEARKEEAGKEEIERERERERGREPGCQVSKSKDRSTEPLDAAKQGGGSSSSYSYSSSSSSSKYPSVIFSSLFLLSLIFYEIFLVGIGFDNSNFIPNFQVEMLFLACLFVCLLACFLSFLCQENSNGNPITNKQGSLLIT
jgi:hypothetical protein